MKKLFGGLVVFLLFISFSSGSKADIGDIFFQVDFARDGSDDDSCSILQITPGGILSEFISSAQIQAVTGLPDSDCRDTGLTTGSRARVFFSEDESGSILVADRNGDLSTFVTDSVVNMLVPETVDWDNGMDTNPVTGALVAADEDNEVIFEFPTDVSTPITNPNLIKILADKDDFLTLVTTVDLEGGIAIDDQENIYIANDDSENDVDNVIFKLTPEGDLSILCTQAELIAGGAGPEVDLDVGMAISNKIYIGDDGDCECVIEVDPDTCSPSILIDEAQIIALTGDSESDLEGGVCIDNDMNLFLGDDGDDDEPNIIKVPVESPVLASLFVSTIEIEDFYQFIELGANPRLLGSCDVQREEVTNVPTLSEWGMISMAAILGIVGFMVARRRTVKA